VTVESPPAATRIADLDALRGLAALAVVLYHYTVRFGELYGQDAAPLMAVPWGHYGVQLFFGISGFVIFMTLDRTSSLLDFAVSRASRLYPAYWTAILLTSAAVALAGMNEVALSPAHTAANLTMMQGFAGLPSVDGVYWTLSVELAFYLAMAALWQLRLLGRIETLLLVWLALRWIWTFAPILTGVEPSWLLGALLVQEHIAFFALGIAAFRLKARPVDARPAWLVVGAALVTVAACDGIEHLVVAVPTAAALLLVALRGVPLLRAAPLVWLGAISYSLYLLHQFIGYALLLRLEAAGVNATAAILLTLGAVLALAAAVTFWVERPALRAIRDRYRRRPAPAPAVAV
jgi:peptidoglycan/LPS O-acetylase OafA/YrhL